LVEQVVRERQEKISLIYETNKKGVRDGPYRSLDLVHLVGMPATKPGYFLLADVNRGSHPNMFVCFLQPFLSPDSLFK
jgi:hypothetical protein